MTVARKIEPIAENWFAVKELGVPTDRETHERKLQNHGGAVGPGSAKRISASGQSVTARKPSQFKQFYPSGGGRRQCAAGGDGS